jgi:peptidoglycan hydrolase-like protein with peptidoglycan-binding domain
MSDPMVLLAQEWVNQTYGDVPGYSAVVEDGITGWSTVYALTRGLQHELGISALSNNFGSQTMAALTAQFPLVDQNCPNVNVVRIVQAGLYCKGYEGDRLSGNFAGTTAQSVTQLEADMGVSAAFPDGVTPKVFKGLLTMDAYVLIPGGRADVQSAQRWLNSTYVNRRDFALVPCDGYFSRNVQKSLMLAIQFELGMNDDTANGVFGPATQAGLKSQAVLTIGASDGAHSFVRLFQAAMIFNRRPVPFDGLFSQQVSDAVAAFQSFAALPVTGRGDYVTWASLLVSTGDPSRVAGAADCVSQITPDRGTVLVAAGYRIVGRYLTNAATGTLNKRLQPGEIDVIKGAGLALFPIFQTYGGSSAYFTSAQGAVDAAAALDAARAYGFRRGTRIYFAVDFDALDSDVTSNVIPYFQGIAHRMAQLGDYYRVGIYGPRNVCSRVSGMGLSSASFASDMSTGFSGNLGYPLPDDWAFDQIATVTLGSGSGQVEIDKDVVSGRDSGQTAFDPPLQERLDVPFDMTQKDTFEWDIDAYFASLGVADTAQYVNDTHDAVSKVLQYDDLFTSLSRAFRMRKSLLQAPVVWEIRKLTYLDDVADAAVIAWYGYLTAYEAWEKVPVGDPPTQPVEKDDASTGLGQIFASTAIDARNFASDTGLTDEPHIDPGDWHQLWNVWHSLHDDDEYNVSTVPLVLLRNADRLGITTPPLDYDDDATRRVLARYNGTGSAADEYGVQLLGLYGALEKYNGPLRNA